MWQRFLSTSFASMKHTRICPVCGGGAFGSYRLSDGTLQRICNGRTSDGRRCDYTWHQTEDEENGMRPSLPRTGIGRMPSPPSRDWFPPLVFFLLLGGLVVVAALLGLFLR